MSDDTLENVLSLLKPHEILISPLTQTAVRGLSVSKVKKFYQFLINASLTDPTSNTPRPECPVKDFNQVWKVRYPYKKGMVDYIAAHWEYVFENPSNISHSLLEATANYLESL